MNDTGSNVARHLRSAATSRPDALATKSPIEIGPEGKVTHEARSFRQLDQASDAAAEHFSRSGITHGTRVLLAVRPGHDLIVGMFGLLKLGAIPVAIDPGMGWSAILDCVHRSRPTALVGVRSASLLSRLPFAAFRTLRHRVTVGGSAWRQALATTNPTPRPLADVSPDTLAAVLFTSGSTGAPKGVCYTHGMFDAQIELVRSTYGIVPGETDMAMLPLFALFNPALGTTTVTPLLDPSRPLAADPAPLVAALLSEKVTCSFGSPAIWSKVADHCEARGIELPDLRRLLIAGAPVSGELLAKLRAIAPNCVIHTPYGATECLPVTTIAADELWGVARELALLGQGTCVGRAVSGVEIRVIKEVDGSIATLGDSKLCAAGEIGEIIATGPSVTREYDGLPEATRAAKIADGDRIWHRMGDLGALDSSGRLFFLGRRVEKVRTPEGDLPTESIEPAFRQHPHVFRCALIGIGVTPRQTGALVVEPRSGHFPETEAARARFIKELRELARINPQADRIREIVFQRALPVDVRHNAKIHRLQLAKEWTSRLAR
ncbi:MAG: fatty acid CoA ligase family protein [Verrucomicrobiota bacterium]